ncbi:glutathionylspermidine synthase family protein [Marininema halotolerans]|uniref:Glutathionylspermidine synthase n=1 Tax=Marininema halotolerans TaxID=1155944 RepID=A0A1I6NYU5_9BACL|nr:glutathionylspermidine synthase family protein [Marininema halotolerans]SFS33111.1 Glutathionylspermidine synthase [Marininema halotolerans]
MSKLKTSYKSCRREIYEPMQREGVFTWDRCHGAEYALAQPAPISKSLRNEMADATEALGAIFARVTKVVQGGGVSLLQELGLPEATWKAVRVGMNHENAVTLIGRFDFAMTDVGLKMLEFNSDTPTGIVEAFYVNQRVCTAWSVPSPNEGEDLRLKEAFTNYLSRLRQQGKQVDQVVFSSLGWHEEDAGTTRYLMEQSGVHAQFIPLDELRVSGDRLYTSNEDPSGVDVWYRLHALEILAEETEQDGYPTGKHVLDLIAHEKLSLINPPSAFIAQTKALQALIWNLYEAKVFLTEEECETVRKYMLPTYLYNAFKGRTAYVVKPIFGREGGGVLLCDEDGNVHHRDGEKNDWEQSMIWQERVSMEEVEAETLAGTFRGQRLWGSFLIDGKASAILARLDGPITGNLAFYQPIFLTN